MSTNFQDSAPRLAPPGAGLPQPELTIARLLLRWELWRTDRAKSAARFARERDVALALARDCSPDAARRRVLIKRLPGLEDSSRYWSVYMTFDHLRIVNHGIGEVIRQLAEGTAPAGLTGTADVKPSPTADETVLAGFEEACARFEQTVAQVGNLRTTVKHPHPWFGPLDAGEWYYLAGFHMGLHQAQIRRILAGGTGHRLG